MKIAANRKNLKAHSKALLGNEYTPEKERALIHECLTGFKREPGHVSHSRGDHLDRIGAILGTFGTEGILLNAKGEDQAGTCSEQDVALDVQYCNAGDTYAITVLYVNGELCLGDWGTVVEAL